MADVTPHYKELRSRVYRLGAGKEELKALGSLPTKAEIIAMFQVYEDFMTANSATIKAGADAALGVTMTNPLFKKTFAAYLEWKMRNL